MEVVVDCGGVGYLVSVPLSTSEVVSAVGESVTLFTILSVREDAMQLFGFSTVDERNVFRLLTGIQGIGGRIALGILSAANVPTLIKAIANSDLVALQRLPGIGKKTAERMIVELREKVLRIDATVTSGVIGTSTILADAVSALQALGYSKIAAERAVNNVVSQDPDINTSSELLIRKALKFASQ